MAEKGTASGKNGLDSTDENKEKKLTAYAGTKKKGSGSGTSGEKKSSKKADAVKDKTKEKTEESSTEELTESKEKETTSGTASASSKNEGKSIPELVGSKVNRHLDAHETLYKGLILICTGRSFVPALMDRSETQFQKNKKQESTASAVKNPKGR